MGYPIEGRYIQVEELGKDESGIERLSKMRDPSKQEE